MRDESCELLLKEIRRELLELTRRFYANCEDRDEAMAAGWDLSMRCRTEAARAEHPRTADQFEILADDVDAMLNSEGRFSVPQYE